MTRRSVLRRRNFRVESLEPRNLLATGIGVFNPRTDTFSLRNEASAGPASVEFQFASPGRIPVVGDWNGDEIDDYGVFESGTARWSLRYGAEAGPANAGVFRFGEAGSVPIVGDWNGDGRDDIGTYKAGSWQLRYGASPGLANAGTILFGDAASQPIVGDWDGDGIDGIGIFNPTNNRWTLRQTVTSAPATGRSFFFGPTGGTAVSGDWNGDGVDGIGVYQIDSARWTLRQTPTAGAANAGRFTFGARGWVPVTGDFDGPAAPDDALATIVLPPINLDLLGLEVRTSPITVNVSANPGDGKLLGNVLGAVSNLVDLGEASNALNEVLDSTVDLLNSASLSIDVGSGPLDSAPASGTQILELFVAPVALDLLGLEVDTSPIRVTITTKSGEGLVLGNVVTELINLFNPPLPEDLDIDFLNTKLDELLVKLDEHLPGIAPAPVPPVPISEGQILNVTVPPLDLNLLGLVVETSPITVNASATSGDGALLGNVLTTALRTLDATPENLSELNTNINEILARVVGVLNAADLSLLAGVVDDLPPVLQTLLSDTLTAPAAGASAPILDLMIASTDGVSPPVNVDLLGLSVTTSNIEAHVSAETGEGQVLGNLLYNVANLADPGGPASLLFLLNALGAGNLDDAIDVVEGAVSPPAQTPDELLTLTVNPLNIDLLGLQVQTDPIVVTLSTQGGDGKLLGNLLNGLTTLINVDGISTALNNVLATTVDLLNSASLIVDGVGSGTFDDAAEAVTPVLDLFVAPVHLDLLGLVATTEPIHVTITAESGQGLVLGNVVTALANLFNPPLPDSLDIDFVNERLEELIDRLAEQIPGIPPAPVPPVELEPEQFLELTVPPLDLDLLGLLLQSSPITVNASAHVGDGLLLGNVLTTVLNTVNATTENLTGLSENLNAILAKVVGVLNAADLVLPAGALGLLPGVLQTLALPLLIAPQEGATTEILDLTITSNSAAGPPVDVDLLGLSVSTSNIEAHLLGQTGQGKVLGNLLYNVAHLLDGGPTTLLSLLAQLGRLDLDLGASQVRVAVNERSALASAAVVSTNEAVDFTGGGLHVRIAAGDAAGDRLAVEGRFWVDDANNVRYRKVAVGRLVFASSTELIIEFNSNATPAVVEQLVRAITFRPAGAISGEREILFTLSAEGEVAAEQLLVASVD